MINIMNKKLILLRGIPGSGKSTKAKQLASPLYICEADDYWLNCVGDYLFVPEKIGKAHAWCQNKVSLLMMAKRDTIVISNTNITRKDRQVYIDMAKDNGYEVEIVLPDSPWFNEILPRIRNKTFTDADVQCFVDKNTHNVPFEAIKRMMTRWED